MRLGEGQVAGHVNLSVGQLRGVSITEGFHDDLSTSPFRDILPDKRHFLHNSAQSYEIK